MSKVFINYENCFSEREWPEKIHSKRAIHTYSYQGIRTSKTLEIEYSISKVIMSK